MANYNQKVEADNRKFVPSIRSILYLIGFVLIFALTCAELGLVSQQIHKYGRFAENYASLQYKNVLGLLLCACLVSLLVTIFHLFLNVGFVAFFSLVLAVFFGTGAGVIRTATPFRGTSCGRPADAYPEKWQRFAHECSRIVSIEAVAWSLWGFLRATPGGFYGSHTRSV
ncbi:hypothetical protein JR316_0008537 [Psilocybe cubensis]|uniref:Uncharacterized protein n=1 Tax=Psilocybe cubensis TaxID=181762 RepID=A0ACB8GWU1_PSICU|nr:hypothetical protein JR316_0008537 [Psilocybe cubensis]KAH9479940.1 hypothetical protein JR316_0008537 [Psilocybe cubensis]